MDIKQKKAYERPVAEVVWLDVCMPLLAGSGGTLGDYDTINEGDEGGWHD